MQSITAICKKPEVHTEKPVDIRLPFPSRLLKNYS